MQLESNDLLPALVKNGCGTGGDWNQVFDVIKLCNSRHLSTMESSIANQLVKLYRDNIRAECVEVRENQEKPIEIDEGLGGLQCFG